MSSIRFSSLKREGPDWALQDRREVGSGGEVRAAHASRTFLWRRATHRTVSHGTRRGTARQPLATDAADWRARADVSGLTAGT
jgi:hypothetical protein